MKYYLGVDIGGTNITCGVVDEEFNIVAEEKIKTCAERGYKAVLTDITALIDRTAKKSNIGLDKIRSIGIGCPGTCNIATGCVEYSNNLRWDNEPLQADIEKATGKKVYIDNDANAAAYGEYIAGAAKGARNAVVITIGTGIGAGVIIDGKLYSGSNYAGAEIGHTVIVVDGYECTCGRRGCFEAYSSATGLVRMTREAAEANPKSKLRELVENDGRISARTAFNAAKLNDDVGFAVVERYIKHLACGIANTINVFQPDILCIGGGVCNEGEYLLKPLRKQIAENIYSKNSKKNTEIVICSLANNAGVIGAAMLYRMYEGGSLFKRRRTDLATDIEMNGKVTQ